jgi:seryl-tRNA synthetase
MLDIKFIRENLDEIRENNKNRRVEVDLDRLCELDDQRRGVIQKIDDKRALRNQTSKGKPSDEDIQKMRVVGDEISRLEAELSEIEKEYQQLLLKIPNLTHPDVPIGGEEDFKELKDRGIKPQFKFEPKDHEELMLNLDVIDFERGAKVAAAKFYFTKKGLVLLNQALIRYGMDIAAKHGYEFMETPDMARNEILLGTGYNPRGPETQIYSIENTDLSLIATAEIPVGGYHANEIIDLSKGPKKYVALSHCFRTEAGSHGRVSKGLYRVHQFTKLELFLYCKPSDSNDLHRELLEIEQEICDGLGLHYRVIDIASGDLGGPAYRKFDLEAWMHMKKDEGYFGEITSTSNCTDYQSRRLNIRYKNPAGETEFVHTLNGTAVATSRLPVAIFEQFQQEDGSIAIPKVLQSYMGGMKYIEK